MVDDHKLVTDGLTALLDGTEDFVIKAQAPNGQAAIEMLLHLKIDVILMDIDMPVMNGIEATKIIKRDMPDKKIIVLTMHDENAMIRTMLDIGADGYLLKTSGKNEITRAIRDVMDGKKYYSEDVNSKLLEQGTSDEKSIFIEDLTEREIQIIKLIAEGFSNKEIGEKLFISHRTVDTHRTNLMNKLDLHNVAGIVRFAITRGLI